MSVGTTTIFEERPEHSILRNSHFWFYICDVNNKKKTSFYLILGSYTFYGANMNIFSDINFILRKLGHSTIGSDQYKALISKMKNHEKEHGSWARGIKPKPLAWEHLFEVTPDQVLNIKKAEEGSASFK